MKGFLRVRHLITAAVVVCLLCLVSGRAAAVTADPGQRIMLLDANALQRLPPTAVPAGAALTQVIDHPGFATVTAPMLPATQTDVWYRFALSNPRDKPVQIVVDFTEMLFDEIELHTNLDGRWTSTLTGLKHPYDSRALDYPYFAFPLDLPALYDGHVYVRVNSAHLPGVSPSLYGSNLFHQTILIHHGTSLLLIGILAGVILIMSMIIATLREMRLFALIALLAGMLVNIAYSNGFLFKLMPHQTDFHRTFYIYAVAFTNIMWSQLYAGLFDLRHHRPLLFALSLLPQVASLAIAVLAAFHDPAPYILMINAMAIAIVLLACITGIDAQLRKAQSAALFNAGLISWLIVTLYTILGASGVAPFNFWSRHAYEVGLLVLCVFFSLTIIDRMRYYRRQHDALLQKAAVAETRDQLKSEFLAAMSHEIRTPLNGVLGMAQMLMHTEQSTAQRHYTDIIVASGKTLLNVLNDILDLSKIEAGKLRLIEESVDLGQLITYASTIAASFPEKRAIHFEYRIDPAVPVFVLADNSRLQQILNNLLTNAFKFTDRGSIHFSVDLAADQLALAHNHVRLRFSVRDTGVGISQEQCRELFKPYAQIELRQPSPYRGTGLGLSICKQLVELMQGHIGVSSTPGAGSEFWFDVPAPIDVERQRDYETMCNALHGKHLLIANIAEKHTRLLTEHFTHFGMQVSHASVASPEHVPACDILMCMPASATPSLTAMIEHCRQHHQTAILLIPTGIADQSVAPDLPAHIVALRVPAGISDFVAAMYSAIAHQTRNTLAPASHVPTVRPLRVLVAEDNPVNQKVVAAMLQRLGATHTLTANGREALELLQQQDDFDLVLMDCEMPVMDGYQATANIRRWEQENGRRPLPIVALTAHALPDHFERCRSAGMDRVLTKPLDINELATTLNELGA